MGIYLFFSLEHRSRHVITQSSAHVRWHVSAAALRDRIYSACLLYPTLVYSFVSLLHSFVSDSFIWFKGSRSVFFSEKCVSLLWQHLFGRISPAKILNLKLLVCFHQFVSVLQHVSVCIKAAKLIKKQLTSTHRLLQYPKCWRLHFFFVIKPSKQCSLVLCRIPTLNRYDQIFYYGQNEQT